MDNRFTISSSSNNDYFYDRKEWKPRKEQQNRNAEEEGLFFVRERQWMYLGPIAATPIAHIAVTLYRDAKTPRQKQLIAGVGILGSSVMTLGMRLYLMSHAGYPGQEASLEKTRERILEVSKEEKNEIVNPSIGKIVKQAMRGFA
ncbi:hypothetical protein CTEN210_00643 [Chaetoceros tenuissimus]|uniref:Uncharacterized protein n=1 Tax=Chaetoceros tenuissimus TaxID=426638 RepID=A0AAD3CEI5_9STRA|nr:hypothetical protein CTEN210_00643 [Chaetoceros tenuissimus]